MQCFVMCYDFLTFCVFVLCNCASLSVLLRLRAFLLFKIRTLKASTTARKVHHYEPFEIVDECPDTTAVDLDSLLRHRG